MDGNKIIDIIKDYKDSSNKELITAMDFINEEFETTKKTLIDLSKHLDFLTETYNSILDEYNKRTKQK
jgi:prefoldin subunit 5